MNREAWPGARPATAPERRPRVPWPRLYALVIGLLALEIALLALLTRSFR